MKRVMNGSGEKSLCISLAVRILLHLMLGYFANAREAPAAVTNASVSRQNRAVAFTVTKQEGYILIVRRIFGLRLAGEK